MGGKSSKGPALSDYKQYGVLGTGAFGTVVAAKCRDHGDSAKGEKKLVALKFQSIRKLLHDPSHCKDAQRELDLLLELQRVKCPFIMGIHAAFRTESDIVLVLPLIFGGDLRYHLDEYGRFEISRVRLLSAEICLGLEAIHSLDMVYRDLKPENVLLSDKGHVRITDFDRSRHVSEPNEEALLDYVGTPGYMAPELINIQEYDQGIDVWSLGTLIYELIHDELPFSNEISFEKRVEEKHFPIPTFKRCTDHAKAMIMSMLAFNARDRIGCKGSSGKVDWSKIRELPFFKTLDFKKVSREEIEPEPLQTLDERVSHVHNVCYKHKKAPHKEKEVDKLTEQEHKKAERLFAKYTYDARKKRSSSISLSRVCSGQEGGGGGRNGSSAT